MIAAPLYLVTRRLKQETKELTVVTTHHVGNKRGPATVEALRLCDKGIPTVVYECKIIEVHHPTKKARKERIKRLKRQRKRAQQ